jgi:SprT-like protein
VRSLGSGHNGAKARAPFGQKGLYGERLRLAIREGESRLRAYARRYGLHPGVLKYRLGFSNLMTSSSGKCFFREKRIVLSGLFFTKYGWTEMDQTLRHELVHAALHEEGLPLNHASAAFKAAAERLGARPWHDMALEPNYIYECPACGRHVMRVRPLRPDTACGVHGEWAEEYVLILKWRRTLLAVTRPQDGGGSNNR